MSALETKTCDHCGASVLEEVSNIEQTMAFLKLDEAKLRRLVGQRKIGVLKQGHTLTFTCCDIKAYVNKYRTAVSAPNPHGLTNASNNRIRGRAA